jgi:uncharacterized protein involved in copper resistance
MLTEYGSSSAARLRILSLQARSTGTEQLREEQHSTPAPHPPQATKPAAKKRTYWGETESLPVPAPLQPDQAAKPAIAERESKRQEEHTSPQHTRLEQRDMHHADKNRTSCRWAPFVVQMRIV